MQASAFSEAPVKWWELRPRNKLARSFLFGPRRAMLLSLDAQEVEVFNFGIAKILVTTEITEFCEIQPKFRQNFFRD